MTITSDNDSNDDDDCDHDDTAHHIDDARNFPNNFATVFVPGGQRRCAMKKMSLLGVRGASTTTRESFQKSEISTDSAQAAPHLAQ